MDTCREGGLEYSYFLYSQVSLSHILQMPSEKWKKYLRVQIESCLIYLGFYIFITMVTERVGDGWNRSWIVANFFLESWEFWQISSLVGHLSLVAEKKYYETTSVLIDATITIAGDTDPSSEGVILNNLLGATVFSLQPSSRRNTLWFWARFLSVGLCAFQCQIPGTWARPIRGVFFWGGRGSSGTDEQQDKCGWQIAAIVLVSLSLSLCQRSFWSYLSRWEAPALCALERGLGRR